MTSINSTADMRSFLETYDGPPVRIMEVCGTHTHEIFRQGIRKFLSPKINLISGPGCPVCVTPAAYIDEAVYLALEKGCTVTTFGDLVRVPGNVKSLQKARAEGGKVKIVYSPIDAEKYAKDHSEEQVVFLSVGFETTTPSDVIAVKNAVRDGLDNFSLLAIIGTKLCRDLAERGVSGTIAGFTGDELLAALAVTVKNVSEGKPFFVNAYPRVVTDEGSPAAVALVDKFMKPCDAEWRGIGVIPDSGVELRDEYAAYDARKKYSVPKMEFERKTACKCGIVLQGKILPSECPLFGKACNPDHPVGACMVSDEGACSAFYMYGGQS